jgi:hypothetical protein
MRNVSPIRQSPAATIEILLGTRLQAESGASHRKQRLGALSTRYTKSLPLASRDAVPERSSLASPDALSTKPAPSARHSASPGRKAWVNQITTFTNILPALRLRTGAASPACPEPGEWAQAFCPARLTIFQPPSSVRPCLPASVPRDGKINRQPELIESCVSRSKQSPLPKINRQLSGTRSFRLSALLVTRHLLALPALTKEGSAREGSLVTAFLIETRTGLFGCGVLGGGGGRHGRPRCR